jgi:hypothetical protein
LALNSDYSLSGAGNNAGGTLTAAIAPLNGDQIYIERNVAAVQQTAYPFNAPFPAASHEKALDRLTMLSQQLLTNQGRTLVRSPLGNTYDLGTNVLINAGPAANDADVPNYSQVKGLVVGGPSALLAQPSGSSLVGYAATGAGAQARTLQEKLQTEEASVLDYMTAAQRTDVLSRTGAIDVTQAFIYALASNPFVYVPPGKYNVSSPIPITRDYQIIRGAGMDATVIVNSQSNQNVFVVTSGLTGWKITDMTITRALAGASGGNGIHCPGTNENAEIRNVTVDQHYVGIYVSTTDWALMENVTASRCTQDGIYITNATNYGPSQWKLTNVLVKLNGRDGIRVQSTDGPPGLILGTWNDVETFANSGRGIHIIGSATTPVFDLRLNQTFVGDDGLAGIRLDTHGSQHRITNAFIERIGVGLTGPTYTTAATNTGHGIELAGNETDLTVTGAHINTCSYCGIRAGSGELNISGSQVVNNGAAGVAGQQAGVQSDGGGLVVTGCTIGNRGSTAQKYGVTVNHDNFVITGNRLNGNGTKSVNLSAGVTNGVVLGNSPSDILSNHPAGLKVAVNDGLIVGNAAGGTGGSFGGGTINTGSGVLKNGTAYNNP